MSSLPDVPDFAERVAEALRRGIPAREMADEFEAMISAPDRWARGVSRPRPRVQRLVLEWIEKRLQNPPPAV